ncbi:ribosomal maturation YjgA family protein [Flavobacterium aquidurense]|uniref:ribosomal maturation YjgA family protein n=1 Tax=Flavobacterium aquidurense TaxID=362413 RepID=UPI00371A326B
MKKYRPYYFILLLLIIFMGIMSRKTDLIPLYIGDFLYAVMMYVFIRTLLIEKKSIQIMITSLLICYAIEFSQLYQAIWINELRNTLAGRYTLGQGFLWSDILAYTLGISLTFMIERMFLKHKF